MKKFLVFMVLTLVFMSVDGISAQKASVAISPGSEISIAKVGTACPTFSWTAVEGSVAYRLEIFRAAEPVLLIYDHDERHDFPILVKEIPGAATSWTPSIDEGLKGGEAYVWFVRALDEHGSGAWSEGRMFEINTGFEIGIIEDALNDAFEEHAIDKSVIDDVLERVDAYTPNSYDSTSGSGIPISIQGNETGSNTYYGESAGFSLTTGTYNTFMGYQSGYSVSVANSNTCIGYQSGHSTSSGGQNIFIGYRSGYSNTTGANNTFLGHAAGYFNTASENTFMGTRCGNATTTGGHNTFVGYEAGTDNTTGGNNTLMGSLAGFKFTDGANNVAIGYQAGYLNQSGNHNTFIGTYAGYQNTGSGNVFIGHYVGGYEDTCSNRLIIGNHHNSKWIWGDKNIDVLSLFGKIGINTMEPNYPMELRKAGANASVVVNRTDGVMNFINATSEFGNFGTVNDFPLRLVTNAQWHLRLDSDRSLTMRNGATCTAGGVWTNASSRDLKQDINDLSAEQAIEALNDLQPVTYKYKADMDDEHVGFIAEDVPDLVASKDRKGMSPMDVVAVLTKVVQEQQRTINELQKAINVLRKESKD